MVAGRKAPPKFYILDMFPYPSGAGLHVGHPEGYTATDILARYKRAQGFNVLHPMGWDAFGLPAEQYAVKTGRHPRKTTEQNIATFKRQIQSLGFSYDWSRELATTDPDYFKWTQWIFLKLYNSWFNPDANKAESIEILEDILSENPKREFTKGEYGEHLSGLRNGYVSTPVEHRMEFRHEQINKHRLAYVSEQPVWWCEALGTVLANEEVVDGKSEVGDFPVVRKPMRQWMLRISAFAERLLTDLETIDWTDSLKEMQRNWIGRSEGATVEFGIDVKASFRYSIRVFTTRPDTLFGATYLVLAPEHQFLNELMKDGRWPENTPEIWKGFGQSWANTQTHHGFKPDEIYHLPPLAAVETYRAWVARKSDLERTEFAKEKTGVFTGLFAINPVNNERIPIFMADYVLASYGTGAIMAVPAHDERDFEFATKFGLEIRKVIEPSDTPNYYWRRYRRPETVGAIIRSEESRIDSDLFDKNGKPQFRWDEGKAFNYFGEATELINSTSGDISFNGMSAPEAKKKITDWLEVKGLGKKTVNYKLRDWLFSRQRYWGEPFPIVWKRDAAGNLYHEALPESALPVLPPPLDDYKPTPDGQPPLARARDWVNLPDGSQRETNTMPQWAGSCWYYLRFLDAKNSGAFVGKDAENYWMGSVAAVCDRRHSPEKVSDGHRPPLQTPGVDLYVGGTEHAVLHLLYARFWHKVLYDLGYVSTPEPFFKLVNQGLILGEDGQKMSKSRGNVVNPDDILVEHGADAFRLYEMFMGPLEMVKPWNTKGVEGVYRFLGRVWRLFVDEKSETEFEQAETTAKTPGGQELLNLIKLNAAIKDVAATPAQLKALHACIKKVTEDLDGLRFNTAISAMMVLVNEAMTWETKPVSALREFLILLQPFAPHIAEELWEKLSTVHSPQSVARTSAGDPTVDLGLRTWDSLPYAPWPKFDPALLVESEMEIPVQVNGKLRDVIKVPANADYAVLEAAAKASEKVQPFIAGKTIKKVIVVPKKLVNIAVS